MLAAEDLYRRGVELSNGRRYAGARRALLSATSRTSDPNLRARIAGTLAYVMAQTGEPAEAERLCSEALAAADLDAGTVAVLCGQLGTLLMHAGRLDQAADWLDRGIQNSHDPVAIANMLTNRGMVQLQRRNLDDAAADFKAAAAEYASQEMPLYEARVLHNLGYIALLEGDLVRALAEMRRVFPLFTAESAISGAIGELDQAEVLRDAGLTTEAERVLERVAHTFGAHGMRQARGEAEFNLARSLLVHDPGRAAKVAGAAVRRFRALGSDSWAARALAVRLRAGLRGGRGNRAARPGRAEVEAAASDLDRLGFGTDATALRLSLELSEARDRGRDPSSAEPSPRTGGVRVPGNAPIQLRLLGHEVRAARAAAAGRNGEARRHAARGLDDLGEWQRSFGSLDLQTSITMHGTGLVLEGLRAAVGSGRPELVFEWSERARHLNQQVVPLRPPPDPQLADDLAELRSLRAEDPTGDWLSGPRAAVLRDRARHRQWTTTAAAGLDERVTLEQLRGAVDPRTAFASYVLDGESLSCLVVTDGGTRLIRVGAWPRIAAALAGLRADLDVSASVRTGPMATVVAAALAERLVDLSRVLVEAPLAAVGDRRLVLTAPGALAGVPWPMLPGLRGRPFTLATSATRWVTDRGRVPAPGVGFATGPGVERGEDEVALAAAAWQEATTLQGPSATVDAVTGLASGVGLLHLAAHGRHAVDNPLFSGLELADGALFGYDLDRMPRVPEVVVLSACEVGRSAVRWGEEAIGMTRAWLHAGAACVVAAPVVVADDVACELLGAVHAGLAAGQSPAEALAGVDVLSPFQCHGSGF